MNRKCKRYVFRICSVLLLCCLLCSVFYFHPIEVQAKKNNNIEQLIMVGTRNVNEMYPVIQNQENHDGDVYQHQWVNNLDGVVHCISDDPEKAAKQAVVLWVGEEYLDDKKVFTCADGKSTSGNTVDLDGDGKPSDVIKDTAPVRIDVDGDGRPSAVVEVYPAVYNATSLARALCGYDYDVEYWSPMVDGAGNPVWDVEPSTDPDTGIITDGVQRQELKTKTEHAKGYAEIWIEKGVKVYVASLGPVSKEKGNGSNGVLDVMGDVPANQKTLKFNETFKANIAGITYLDVYDLILEHVPYYSDGGVGGENSHYDAETLRWIFHMLWNTILEDNPNKEPPEAIDVSLYSVSCSLTSYMNTILGVAGNDTHEDHKLKEAGTEAGDAGAFLGFGDSDYDFHSFITGQFSKTSSVVDYGSLLSTEPGDTDNMYCYARYGKLLSDMGLDQTSTELVGIGPRAIPGVMAMLFYVLSSGLNLGFSQMLSILKLLNPFQFFANTDLITASLRSEMSDGSAFSVSGVGASLVSYIGSLYNSLQDMGVLVILPLMLCIIIVSLLFNYKRGVDTGAGKKVYTFFIRAIFICAGIPLLGCVYTACLNNVCEIVSTSDCASTQMVASTFVNFGEWAKQFRLSPKAGNTNIESFVLEDSTGVASESSYKNLRHTAYQINKSTKVVNKIDMSGLGLDSLKDVNSWNKNVMNLNEGTSWDGSWETVTKKFESDTSAMKQATGLIIPWLKGTFYHSSDFESDTMSVFSDKHGEELTSNGESLVGRRPGLDESDPPDNSETLYELFENTSTPGAWNGRTADENTDIFKDTGDYKWHKFNIFANGSLKAVKHGDKIEYKDPDAQQCNETGTGSCLSAVMGLSTVSMYNYLSTDFQNDQIVIYSQAKAASSHTSKSHFAVNMIGSGIWNTMYYLNMVVVMLVISVIGIYYMCGMVWNNVKQTFTLLAAIPGAMLGILRSIVNIIVIVVTMMAEILGTVILYEVLSDLIGVFATLLDGGFYQEYDINTTSLIGGRLAFVAQKINGIAGMSNTSMLLHFGIFAVLGIGMSVVLIKYAKRFQTCYASVCELLLYKLVPYDDLWYAYYERKTGKTSDKQFGFPALVQEVLFAGV